MSHVHSVLYSRGAIGETKSSSNLKTILPLAAEIDPAEKIASFGRWWFDADGGEWLFSAVAARLLDASPGLYRNLEAWFGQVVPDDLRPLQSSVSRMNSNGAAIDIVIRVINELDGVRWLRMVSLPRDREAQGILSGMLLDITSSQHAAIRERLSFESSQLLVGANTLNEAITNVIRSVCENLGWEWGAYWELDDAHGGEIWLKCQHRWHDSAFELESFARESVRIRVAPGDGLVGRVWLTGQAAWVDGAPNDADCPRSQSVHECGLKSGYAFPVSYVMSDGRRHSPGVLEFCSSLPRQREAQLPNLSKAIGALVAQTVQRIEQIETIRRMAQMDAMTGLTNRSHFHQMLTAACLSSETNGNSFGVMFIDLDRFKPINDAYGHDAGNLVLLEFSRRMVELVPEGCQVGRLGGDEFAILANGCTKRTQLEDLARMILAAANTPFHFGHVELTVSASIGISRYPENGTSTPELLRSADAAMYRSKNEGRNGYCFASGLAQTLQPAIVQQLSIEVALHHALQDNEFFIEYQPIFDSFGKTMIAVEALIRWRNASGEVVRPDVFIPVAEKSRLIVHIGRWVMRQACHDLASFQRAGFTDLQLNVNMAAAEFTSATLPDELLEVARGAGIRPQDVSLELTESMVMQHADKVIPVMQTLRHHGFHISLDDFGMGHSSLSRLKTLPITSLKIDRSFVRGLPHESGDCAIVRTIFALGQHMKLQIIAEGVETDAQLVYLRQFGYPLMQGFLLARPMSAEALMSTFTCKDQSQ